MSEAAPRWERGQAQLCLSGSTGSIQSIYIPTDSERPSGFVPVLDLYQSWICTSTSCRVCIPVGTRSQILAFSLGGDPCAGRRGRGSSAFLPTWSNPTFPSLALGSSRSDFAKFASSMCEFSDKFCWFWFFFPLDLRRAQQGMGVKGEGRRGRSGKGGFGAGNSDMDTINGPGGSCTQSPLCVPHKGWVSSVCKQHQDSRDNGIPRERQEGGGIENWSGEMETPTVCAPSRNPCGSRERLSRLFPAPGMKFS